MISQTEMGYAKNLTYDYLKGVTTAKDTICFNGHRFYGKVMYPHLFANFIQIHSGLVTILIFIFVHFSFEYSLKDNQKDKFVLFFPFSPCTLKTLINH